MTWWSYGKGVHRRDAIRALGAAGAGSFAPAGGQVSQRPDQGSNPPASVVAPTQSAGTLRARVVIISGTGAGVFIYDPSAGAGNMIASGTDANADPSGNKTLAGGWSVYNNAAGSSMIMTGDSLQGYTGSEAAGWTFAGAAVSLNTNVIQLLLTATGSGSLQIIGPSGDTTGAIDSAMFTSQLRISNAVVILVPGTYYIDAPITVPDHAGLVCLQPSWGIPTGNYGNGSLALQGAVITAGSSFSGASLIAFNPTGDASTQHGGQFLTGITIDGTGLPAANTVYGIESKGFVAGVKLTDVVVSGHYNSIATTGLGNHGLYAHNDGTGGHNPDFWQITRCKFSGCGGYGMETIAMSDSWYTDGECTGNNLGGANIQNGGESRVLGWRFNNNATSGTTPGLAWSGLTGFTGKFVVDGGCDFSSNGVGLAVSGGGTGTIALHSPVADGNTTQYTFAGSNHVTSDAAYNTSTAAPTFS